MSDAVSSVVRTGRRIQSSEIFMASVSGPCGPSPGRRAQFAPRTISSKTGPRSDRALAPLPLAPRAGRLGAVRGHMGSLRQKQLAVGHDSLAAIEAGGDDRFRADLTLDVHVLHLGDAVLYDEDEVAGLTDLHGTGRHGHA